MTRSSSAILLQVEDALSSAINSSVSDGHVRPRVLFFSPVSFFKGGAERSLMDLVENAAVVPVVVTPGSGPIQDAMRKQGIETHTIDFEDIAQVHRPFRIWDGARMLGTLYRKARELRALCKAANIDIVHSNGLKAHVIAIAGRCFGAPPTVVHVRDIPYTRPEKAVWTLLRLVASRVVLVSRACWPGETLPSNCIVVHNGLPEAALAVQGERRPRDGRFVVGFVGRIHPAKGLHLLLTWLKSARDAGENVHLVVRGSFSEDSPGYEEQIDALVEELGLRPYFAFEGFVNDTDKVYLGLDAVCVPSHIADPLPRAVMEAMGYGLPVLAYPAGGIPEMITDEQDGFLIADEGAFLRAVRALSDPEREEQVRSAAFLTVRRKFSREALHQHLGAIYNGLLGRPPHEPGAGR